MSVTANADNTTPRLSSAAHPFDVGAGEEKGEEIVEAPVKKDLHGKGVSVCPFDWQKYFSKEICAIIFQVDEMTNPLRAIS